MVYCSMYCPGHSYIGGAIAPPDYGHRYATPYKLYGNK